MVPGKPLNLERSKRAGHESELGRPSIVDDNL